MFKKPMFFQKVLNFKLWPVLLVITSILLVLGLFVGNYLRQNSSSQHDVCIKVLNQQTITQGQATSNGCALSLETADTQAAREKGLSGRNALPLNKGMLFVFDRSKQQCIWMKDMRFNIDILWLDARGVVVKAAQNVSPSTYPAVFCANNTAYVIELAAGVSKNLGYVAGSYIKL